MVETFSAGADTAMVNQITDTLQLCVCTEVTGLIAIHHLSHKNDKIKMRTAVQSVVTHLKKQLARFNTPSAAKKDPLNILPEVLQARIKAALKLK